MPIISTVQDCQVCRELSDSIVVQTGIGERFPDAVSQLVRHDLALNSDLYRCPSCYSLFFWEDRPQCYGSGNLDEESLIRLSAEGTALAWSLLNLSEECENGTQLVKDAFEKVPLELVVEIVRKLSFVRPLAFAHLVPGLVEQLMMTNYSGLCDILSYYSHADRQRAEIISELLKSDPRSQKGWAETLASRCAVVLAKLKS